MDDTDTITWWQSYFAEGIWIAKINIIAIIKVEQISFLPKEEANSNEEETIILCEQVYLEIKRS